MGYRSQVRCLIYGDPDKLQAHITAHLLTNGKVFEHFADSLKRYKTVRRTYDDDFTVGIGPDPDNGRAQPQWRETPIEVLDLCGDSWKWYEGYPDVVAFEAFMRSAPDLELTYEFLRIGEEDTDTERETGGDDDGDYYLGINRSIWCDMPEDVEQLGLTG